MSALGEDEDDDQASPRGPRRRGRELALGYLYACDLRRRHSMEDFDAYIVQKGDRGPAVRFAEELATGALMKRDEVDEQLRTLAENWSLERMAVIDRNILRMGAYELQNDLETPGSVVINEAVELAKRYSTAQSGSFVNGILDRLKDQLGR